MHEWMSVSQNAVVALALNESGDIEDQAQLEASVEFVLKDCLMKEQFLIRI